MTARYGKHTYGKLDIRAWGDDYKSSVITVGSYCSIAGNVVVLLDGNHKYTGFSTYPFKESLGWDTPLNTWGKCVPDIGSDVWIGMNVLIFSGVSIGHGAIIAANTVVTKDVPPYAIVAGNPGIIKKYRFSQDIIDTLLRYPWWLLPEETIRQDIIPTIDNINDTLAKLKELNEETN
jgi:acetyltransferase-like isoleucine patch superfamily enzyme